MTKKKTKRSKAKYPALTPNLNLKTRYEEIEDLASYAHTLSDKDKEWLNSFAEEYINANMKHKGKKVIPNTKENRSKIYIKNNARNRDVLTQAKAQGKALYIDDVFNSEDELDERLREMNLHDKGDDGN